MHLAMKSEASSTGADPTQGKACWQKGLWKQTESSELTLITRPVTWTFDKQFQIEIKCHPWLELHFLIWIHLTLKWSCEQDAHDPRLLYSALRLLCSSESYCVLSQAKFYWTLLTRCHVVWMLTRHEHVFAKICWPMKTTRFYFLYFI